MLKWLAFSPPKKHPNLEIGERVFSFRYHFRMNSSEDEVIEERKRMSMFYGPQLSLKTRAWRAVFSRPIFSILTLMASAIMLTQIYFSAEDTFLRDLVSACDMVNENFRVVLNSGDIITQMVIQTEVQAVRMANQEFVRTMALMTDMTKHYVLSHIEQYYRAPVCVGTTITHLVSSSTSSTVGNLGKSFGELATVIGKDISGIFREIGTGLFRSGIQDAEKRAPIGGSENNQRRADHVQARDVANYNRSEDIITGEIDKLMASVINVFLSDVEEASKRIDSDVLESFKHYGSSELSNNVTEYRICDISTSEEGIRKIESYTRPAVYFGVCVLPICALAIISADVCKLTLKRKKAEEKSKYFCKALIVATKKHCKDSSPGDGKKLTIDDARDLMMYAKHPKVWMRSNVFWRGFTRRVKNPVVRSNVRWAVICGIHIPGIICSMAGIAGIMAAGVQIYIIDNGIDDIYSISEYIWGSINEGISGKIADSLSSTYIDFQKIENSREILANLEKRANEIYGETFRKHKDNLARVYQVAENSITSITSKLPQGSDFIKAPVQDYLNCLFGTRIQVLMQIQHQIEKGVSFDSERRGRKNAESYYNTAEIEAQVSNQSNYIFRKLLGREGHLSDGNNTKQSPISQGIATFLGTYKQSLRKSIMLNSLLVLFGLAVPLLTSVILAINIIRDRHRIRHEGSYNQDSKPRLPKRNDILPIDKTLFSQTSERSTTIPSV